MNRPDWKDAPPWARWLAQDANGEFWWFDKPPRWDDDDSTWCPQRDGLTTRAFCVREGEMGWIEEKPQTGKPSWADAPEWAEWLAHNTDGAWLWFSHDPEYNDEHGTWRARGGSRVQHLRLGLGPSHLEHRLNATL